jgi:membrane-bound metal-dependent hydrolase YbcI (DUF457 family)
MPNTLAHLGVQSLLSASIIDKKNYKWLFIGCILPDIPWIARRAILAIQLPVSPYDIELYFIFQSSLFGCLFLSLAIAQFSQNSKKIAAILFINALLHLLLDALQIKWGNGVHLFAPFSWQTTGFNLFWPESPPSIALSILGAIFVGYAVFKLPIDPVDLVLPKSGRLIFAAVGLILYLIMPFAFASMVEAADNQYIGTLRRQDNRRGNWIEFDRRPSYSTDGRCVVKANTGEELTLEGIDKDCGGIVSLRGVFTDSKTVKVHEIYRHWGNYRDLLSYFGLLFIGYYWLRCIRRRVSGFTV